MGERVSQYLCKDVVIFSLVWDTAEGAIPATAQAQELLVQANLESVGTINHRRGTQRKLSSLRYQGQMGRNTISCCALFYFGFD